MDKVVEADKWRRRKKRQDSVAHSISSDHPFQSFDEGDCTSKSPIALRTRSKSVFGCGFSDRQESYARKTDTPLMGCGRSADLLLSKIESLPKQYRRSNRRIGTLNTQLLEAVECGNELDVQRLLEAGASPDATCHVDSTTACHVAAVTNDRSLTLLLKYGAHKHRTDRLGRTPLHIAAWAGHSRHLALFLGLPPEIQKQIDEGEVTTEVEDKVRDLRASINLEIVNSRCELGETLMVPKDWRAGVEHDGSKVAERLPIFQPGWTPLHAASYCARHHCVRLLLAAGADPCLRDVISRTPLDVVGSAYYVQARNKQLTSSAPLGFTEVVALLLATECGSRSVSKRTNLHTPLHTAVELESLESINLLLRAGACPLNVCRNGKTPLHACVTKRNKTLLQAFIYSDFRKSQSPADSVVNVRDKDGYTVLHYSVRTNWLPGVCLTLEAGADVISRSNNGETPLQTAADSGYLDILKEILLYGNEANAIKQPDIKKALFKAVAKGNIECVKILLKHGASIEQTIPNRFSVFHLAANLGLYDMLKFLLDYNYTFTRRMVNYTEGWRGYGPIHFVARNGHIECFKLLLSYNAYINLKTTDGVAIGQTPMHIAAATNYQEIVKFILKNDISSMYIEDAQGWTAFHIACLYASRDVIKLLLREGADLSACTKTQDEKFKKTAIQLIMKNLSKPTEFLHEFFDSCIGCNHSCKQEMNWEVNVDYGVLVPSKHPNSCVDNNIDMKVLDALLKTGNAHDQKRLLIHPLVESFLFLKWKALLPFFFTTVALYGLFAVSLSLFIISVYFYKDSYKENNETDLLASVERRWNRTTNGDENRPDWMNYNMWTYILYFMICLIVSQEILFMKVSKRYFLQLETWIKISSMVLAAILPQATIHTKEDWPRLLATIAILLSWLQMTFLLSRFPKWGYYVLMFRKVSIKVLKILLTFVFVVIGFALSFMIEYRSQIPFENPWTAFVKTMVMMTSEFDYDDLVDKKTSTQLNSSLVSIRLLFLIFLILAAIVLMNLMVAAAVNDLNDLEVQGNIMGLEKQVEFLASLETLVNVKMFMKILPRKLKNRLKFARSLSKISIKSCGPSSSYWKAIPSHIRDAIFDKALSEKEKKDDQEVYKNLQKNIDVFLNTVQVMNPDVVRNQIESIITLKLDAFLRNLKADC